MNHLTNKIQSCGLQSRCNGSNVSAITVAEAQAILDLVKIEFTKALKDKFKKAGEDDSEERVRYVEAFNDGVMMALAAIHEVE